MRRVAAAEPFDRDRAAAEYAAGATLRELGAKYGMDPTLVKHHIRDLVTLRRVGPRASTTVRLEIVRRRGAGDSWTEIAEAMEMSRTGVRSAWTRAVEARRRFPTTGLSAVTLVSDAQIVDGVAAGLTLREIGEQTGASYHTVRNRWRALRRRAGIKGDGTQKAKAAAMKKELASRARRDPAARGLVTP